MTREVNDQELAAVLNLPAPERYDYFVKKAADGDAMWGLRDAEGWVTTADDEGVLHLPVWPHPAFAAACAESEWAGAAPEAIDVDEWVQGAARLLAEDGLRVAVFPTPAGQGISVAPERLKDDFEREQERFSL
jgi:hypothetical protein